MLGLDPDNSESIVTALQNLARGNTKYSWLASSLLRNPLISGVTLKMAAPNTSLQSLKLLPVGPVPPAAPAPVSKDIEHLHWCALAWASWLRAFYGDQSADAFAEFAVAAYQLAGSHSLTRWSSTESSTPGWLTSGEMLTGAWTWPTCTCARRPAA